MTRQRRTLKAHSNNSDNENKNICVLAVAVALGVAHRVHYLHTMRDIVRAARRSWTVRSRKSALGSARTVGAARARCERIGARYYLVRVDGHLLLLGHDGRTLVDTDPRQRDRRTITHFYGVWSPRDAAAAGLRS